MHAAEPIVPISLHFSRTSGSVSDSAWNIMIGIGQIGLSTLSATPFDDYVAGIKNLRLIRHFPKDIKVRSRKTHDTICRLEFATGLLLRRFLCNISSKSQSVRGSIEPIGSCGRNDLACTRNGKAEMLMLLIHIRLLFPTPLPPFLSLSSPPYTPGFLSSGLSCFCLTACRSHLNHLRETLWGIHNLCLVCQDRGDFERHARFPSGTCLGGAARCCLPISNSTFRRSSMVLCCRNSVRRRSRDFLAFALIYQDMGRSESGFDRLCDIFNICRANSNKDVDLTVVSFVSHFESAKIVTSLLTKPISCFSSRYSSVHDSVLPKEQVCTNGIYPCITLSELFMYYFLFVDFLDRGLIVSSGSTSLRSFTPPPCF